MNTKILRTLLLTASFILANCVFSQINLIVVDSVVQVTDYHEPVILRLGIDRTLDTIHGDSTLIFYAREQFNYRNYTEPFFKLIIEEHEIISSIPRYNDFDKAVSKVYWKLRLKCGYSDLKRIYVSKGEITFFEVKLPVEQILEDIDVKNSGIKILSASISYYCSPFYPIAVAHKKFDTRKQKKTTTFDEYLQSNEIVLRFQFK